MIGLAIDKILLTMYFSTKSTPCRAKLDKGLKIGQYNFSASEQNTGRVQ